VKLNTVECYKDSIKNIFLQSQPISAIYCYVS